MSDRCLLDKYLEEFQKYLIREEKSKATVEKYIRDISVFFVFVSGKAVEKDTTIQYKHELQMRNYSVRSINSMLAALNHFLEFMGWHDCKVKMLRFQRQVYCAEEKELTIDEYKRLLDASKANPRLNLVIQTICGTGIRVSELKHFTVEAVLCGEVSVNCKGKIRTILIPKKLRHRLLEYARKNKITSGIIFVTKNGKPLDRSNIWSQMKQLCRTARVNSSKVFPHNLRKLFARTFYKLEKDIAKLADILGHGSIETTRIYIMATGREHQRKIDRLGLVT